MFKKFLILLPAFIISMLMGCDTVNEEHYTYSINKVWWSDSIDANQDGYIQSKKLNFDVRITEAVSRNINARIYYKRSDALSYTFYAYSGEQSVQGGNSSNSVSVLIGNVNKELPRGLYDFKIEICEAGKSNVETATGTRDSIILHKQKFEESSADKNFTISTSWTGSYDRNSNNYFQYARLVINVDVDASVQKNLQAKLLYKLSSEPEYKLYCNIPPFSITGANESDKDTCDVGSTNSELTHGEYDFKIELYEKDSYILLAYADETSNPELNDVKFELKDDDEYLYSFGKIWWSDQVDSDADSFTESRVLNFDVDVDKNEQRTLYALIFYKLSPDTSEKYERYDSTASFNITGTSASDPFHVNIGTTSTPLDSAEYYFMISIYEMRSDSLNIIGCTMGCRSDTSLFKQKFEPASKD